MNTSAMPDGVAEIFFPEATRGRPVLFRSVGEFPVSEKGIPTNRLVGASACISAIKHVIQITIASATSHGCRPIPSLTLTVEGKGDIRS